ncbi:MAG: LptF/LptG family permease, partial [Rickettsiales bacterium]|nr:LptF/LptG family permease [Rickettsiales bacterium]
ISDWKILGLLGTSAFILGIFFATIYSKISVNLLKRSDILERQCKGIVDNRYFIKPKNGIWLKQSSPAAGNSKEQPGRNYTIVIRAAEVFLDDLIFNDVILIIFNSGGFSRRIDARYMQMDDGVLVLHGARIVEQGKNILSQDKITIPTSGWKDFTRRQIQNRYENLQFIDSLSLKKLIGEIKSYGLDAHKFEVKRNNFILLPFMYALMASIGVLLSSRNPRNAKYAIRILFALIIGMLVFTLQNTIVELSLGNKINYLNSTWGLFALATLIAYMKLVDKIELQNFKTTGGSGWS